MAASSLRRARQNRGVIVIDISTVLLFSGCAETRDTWFDPILETSPVLLSKPVGIGLNLPESVTRPEIDRRVKLGDMRMGVAAGWETGAVIVEKEKNEYAGYGPTFSIGLSLPNGSARRALSVHYREEESWLRHHPPGLTEVLKHVVTDPEGFLKEFPSDFALINKVYRTTPKDLEGRYGDDRRKIKGLLSMKRGTCFPLHYFETPNLRCFICAVRFSPTFSVELFDNGGVRRGTWYVEFDMPLDEEAGVEICVQLLAGSAFQ